MPFQDPFLKQYAFIFVLTSYEILGYLSLNAKEREETKAALPAKHCVYISLSQCKNGFSNIMHLASYPG